MNCMEQEARHQLHEFDELQKERISSHPGTHMRSVCTGFIVFVVSLTASLAQTEFGNNEVKVSLNEKDMSWSVDWPGADTAVHGMGFAVEVDGKTLKPQSPSTEVVRREGWTEVRQE